MARTKSASRIPDWFDLNAYGDLADFATEDWLNLIVELSIVSDVSEILHSVVEDDAEHRVELEKMFSNLQKSLGRQGHEWWKEKYASNPEVYAFGSEQSMRRTASILGREAEGRAALARYAARVAEARARLAAHQGETVSIVRWNPKGPSYMFKDAFASTIIEDLGLRRPAHQQDAGHTHSMALSLESLELLDADWLVIGTLATRGEAVEAMRQAERTLAFGRLTAIQAKRFGMVDGSLWTSVGGPLAALQVIEDVETLLGKEDAQPVEGASAGR